MAKFVNSFALLDDEEDDDVDILVDHIVKKIDTPLIHTQKETQSSQFVENEGGVSRGGQGRRDGSRGNDDGWNNDGWNGNGWNNDGWNDDAQGGNGESHKRNISKDSNGSGVAIVDDGNWHEDGGSRARHQGNGKGFGGEIRDGNVKEATGDDNVQIQKDDGGWQDVSKNNWKGGYDGQRKYRNANQSSGGDRRGFVDQVQDNDAADGQRRYRNGNRNYNGERRGYENQVQDNDAADGQRRYRNENRNYNGERRGYENQVQDHDAVNGQRRYRNGNRNYNGERSGYENQVQDNDASNGQRRYRNTSQGSGGERGDIGGQVLDNAAGFELLDGREGLDGDSKFKGEERTHRNGNRSYNRETRDYGGYGGRGSREYPRADSGDLKEIGIGDYTHDVQTDDVNGSGGNAAMVLEVSKAVDTEEMNALSEEINGDIGEPELGTEEQKKKEEAELVKNQSEDLKLKKKEEEDKESALMTLDQYEELLLKKRQTLESLKTEERRVAIDKELEGMRLVRKKQDDSDAKLKSEEAKLKKEAGLEKKDKGRKSVVVEVHEFFKPAFHRRSFGGRGQGRSGGRGYTDQGGVSDRTHDDGPQTKGNAAMRAPPAQRPRARAPLCIPTDKDFPILGAAPPSVKGSA